MVKKYRHGEVKAHSGSQIIAEKRLKMLVFRATTAQLHVSQKQTLE